MLVVAREGSVAVLLGGILAAVTAVSVYALAHYLFFSGRFLPNQFEGYLLFRPVGYANALGVLTAIGVLLALGLVVHGRPGLRTVCTAALVPLLAALQLTSSRGAWFALAVAMAVFLAAERERWRLLAALVAVAPAAIASILLTRNAHLQAQTPRFQAHSAARLGLILLLLTGVTALLVPRALALSRPLLSRRSKITLAALLTVVALGGAALGVRANERSVPIDLSPGKRDAYWHVAWNEWKTNPLLGTGAGTFVHYWQAQKGSTGARDAHNLYLETLAELGVPGLCLLLGCLVFPLVAATRAGHEPLAPAALAAYLAYLVHASLDWDWEMPVVTLSALFCCTALLLAARKPGRRTLTVQTRSWMLAPLTVLLGITAAELVANGAIH